MAHLPYSERPHLIQRMTKNTEAREKYAGIDRWWGLDYMGSAEFEFGSLPEAQKRMAESVEALWVRPYAFDDKTELWAVCLPEQEEVIRSLLVRELIARQTLQRSWYLQEGTWMRRALGRSDSAFDKDGADPRRAWWAIDASPAPFALFQSEEDARLWIECLRRWAEARASES